MNRLARFSVARRKTVLMLWLALLVALLGGWQLYGSQYSTNFSLGDTEAKKATDLLSANFPSQAGDRDQIVFSARSGTLEDADTRAEIEAMLARVAEMPNVASVTSPYSNEGAEQLSSDKKIAYAIVQFDLSSDKLPTTSVENVIATAQASRSETLDVELGGAAVEQVDRTPPSSLTAIGIGAAMIVLLLTFGSFMAMSVPIITALFGLGTAFGLLVVLTRIMDLNEFSIEIAAMIGLGVGIDYALFILTRYREFYAENGGKVEDAVVRAMDTAGRAVIFAGLTVVIALLGMFALGITFLYGLAISSALAVLLVLIGSVTMLPALLGFFGHRIGRSGVLARMFSRRKRARKVERPGFWYRWVSAIQRRPLLSGSLALALMLALTAPVLALRTGSSDASNNAPETTTRKAYDLLSEGFGAGFNGPLTIVTDLSENVGEAADSVRSAVADADGVAAVSEASVSPNGRVAVLTAYPTTSPQSEETTSLVKELRSDVIPPVAESTGAAVYIGGQTATNIDFADALSSKLVYFVGIVVLLSALLLLLVFRSILVPIQAALMNLLSIGASLGLITAVFGLGWFPGIESGPVEAFLPVMMFAIVFGLSMDYEVFLVSRIHEEWMHGSDSTQAVLHGVAKTGKVITAAATVMIVVFASFIFGGERVVQEFGLGLAGAVFLDAFVVRSVLVPAVFALLGDRIWWLPKSLDRRLPHIAIEKPVDVNLEPTPKAA